MKIKIRKQDALKHLFIATMLIFSVLPIYFMVIWSFKDDCQFAVAPWLPRWPWHFNNYIAAWGADGNWLYNNIFSSLTTMGLTLFFAIGGAFFFARYKMPGSRFLFSLFLLVMMYPAVAHFTGIFKLISSCGLYNTVWAIIAVGTAGGQAWTIFVLKNFMEDIPQDFFDAVRIDGGGFLDEIRHVAVPMTLPIIGALASLLAAEAWNNSAAPLLLLGNTSGQMVSTVFLQTRNDIIKDFGKLMAFYVISMLPLLLVFIFSMRLFIRGIASSGWKN